MLNCINSNHYYLLLNSVFPILFMKLLISQVVLIYEKDERIGIHLKQAIKVESRKRPYIPKIQSDSKESFSNIKYFLSKSEIGQVTFRVDF